MKAFRASPESRDPLAASQAALEASLLGRHSAAFLAEAGATVGLKTTLAFKAGYTGCGGGPGSSSDIARAFLDVARPNR